jgi:hypothetical protein
MLLDMLIDVFNQLGGHPSFGQKLADHRGAGQHIPYRPFVSRLHQVVSSGTEVR